MKKMRAIVFLAVVLLMLAVVPAEAYHWQYHHPLWGLGYWPHYPYYMSPLYPPMVYSVPPVIIQQQPQTYIQRPAEQAQQPQPIVWYWCRKPEGFHPYVQTCENNAWMQVIPQMTPPSAPKQ